MKFYGLIIALFLTTSVHSRVELLDGFDEVSASFKGITLQDALTEIANETSIEIVTNSSLNSAVSISYSNITLEKLLKSLLIKHNAIYVRNQSTNEIEKIRIFSGKLSLAKKEKKKKRKPLPNRAIKGRGGFFMRVSANDNKPVRMLVDSGTNILTISLKYANKIGIFGKSNIKVETAAGTTSGKRIIIDSFEMAGLTLKNVAAIILPNLKQPGLIGQNILSQYKQLTLGNKMEFTPLIRSAPPPKKQNKTVKGEPVKGEPVKGEPVKGEPVKGEKNILINDNPPALHDLNKTTKKTTETDKKVDNETKEEPKKKATLQWK